MFPSLWQVLEGLKKLALKRAGLTEHDVQQRIKERAGARASKDFARSDAIRAELADLGIALMDGGDGTMWRPVAPSTLKS